MESTAEYWVVILTHPRSRQPVVFVGAATSPAKEYAVNIGPFPTVQQADEAAQYAWRTATRQVGSHPQWEDEGWEAVQEKYGSLIHDTRRHGEVGPQCIHIDSMVFNYIADRPDLLTGICRAGDRGALLLVITYLQRDQIEAIREISKRELLLRVYDALPKIVMPLIGILPGVWRLDQTALTDDGPLTEFVNRAGKNDKKDALIGITAIETLEASDVIVTDDKRFRKRLQCDFPSCQVWSCAEFEEHVHTLSTGSLEPC